MGSDCVSRARSPLLCTALAIQFLPCQGFAVTIHCNQPTTQPSMPLPPALDRFRQAQEPVWPRVIAELRAGKKRTHWMWFVFPQIQGLGHSDMAQRYAIQSLAEAQAYLAHPVLAGRLRECCQILLDLETSFCARCVWHAGRPQAALLHDAVWRGVCAGLRVRSGAAEVFWWAEGSAHDGAAG